MPSRESLSNANSLAPPALKQLLIQTFPAASTSTHNELLAFAHDHLASAPESRPYSSDWSTLSSHLGHGVAASSGGPQKALHFSQLAARLKVQPLPSNKVAALQLFHALTNDTQGQTATAAPHTPSNAPNHAQGRAEPLPTSHAGPSLATLASPSALPGRRGPTKRLSPAQLLARHRSRSDMTTPRPVSEITLLRDIIYILQGIDSEYIRFVRPGDRDNSRPFVGGQILLDTQATGGDDGPAGTVFEDGVEFVLPPGKSVAIPPTTRTLLHTLSELGWLYRKIDSALSNGAPKGMVEQALHAALRQEMTEYLKLVVWMEGQLAEEVGEDGEDMTLRRLLVWTGDMRLRLRLMAVIIEEVGREIPESGGAHNYGGALLTTLHHRTSHGDPFIAAFASSLLRALAVPFFSMLASWIYEGELRDPFSEFFVEPNADNDGERSEDEGEGRENGRGRWEGKFSFRKEMLPAFLEESFGQKIFSTGKSLNFMKYSCQDTAWVVEHNRKTDGARRVLQYADMPGLEQSITHAYTAASQRLCELFFGPFRLLDHLRNLRDYVLLGKGDFVDILLENLGTPLARPAHSLSRHILTATLEQALHDSNPASIRTSSPTEIFRRLDARMLEYTQGELGWDVFTLEYKVEAPLNTVLDDESLREYHKVFRHLWQIKRVEWEMSNLWRRLMTGARTFLRLPELAFTFHRTRLALSQMVFFVKQLQYYVNLEVISVSHKTFEDTVLKPGIDFDTLLSAHRAYVRRIATKALLVCESSRSKVSLQDLVREILKTILYYQQTADSLCNFALSEAGRADSLHDHARGLSDLPASPVFVRPPSRSQSSAAQRSEETRHGIEERLATTSERFKHLSINLIEELGRSPDWDFKTLSTRLNYNCWFVSGSKHS